MKANFLIVVGCLGILTSNFAIAGYHNCKGEKTCNQVEERISPPPIYRPVCNSCVQEAPEVQNNCEESPTCGSYANANCSCSDPQCFSGNPCLSSDKCCQVFGNIGSSDFEPTRPCGDCS